jgi:hypothetical protein
MGSVFKKQMTKPVPAGAEVVTKKGERVARWKVRGKVRTAPLTTGAGGGDRIVIETAKWFAKYRDGAGVVRVEPTGCRDETAARQVLAELERTAELVRSGVMSAAEAAVGRHQSAPWRTTSPRTWVTSKPRTPAPSTAPNAPGNSAGSPGSADSRGSPTCSGPPWRAG